MNKGDAMNISQINNALAASQNNVNNQTQAVDSESRGAAFSMIFDATIRMLENTSQLEHEATTAQMDYISGRSDDMLSVMLAEQRAQTAVSFTTQITSRVMDAYRQIMNMQI